MSSINVDTSRWPLVLATVYLIQPPVSQTVNFASVEANVWLEKITTEAGLKIPPR